MVSCDVSSDTEDTTSDRHNFFGNFVDNAEVTINLFKLTPQDVISSEASKASDDQTFFRELSMLREKRASRIE